MIPGGDSAAAVTPQIVRQLGAQFWCRYLADWNVPRQQFKIIGFDELRALRDAGIPVVFNWESDGTPGNGYGTGAWSAQQAQTMLNDRAAALGDSSLSAAPVIFSFADPDSNEPDIATVLAAVDGAVSVLGWDRVGLYARYDVIKACFDGNHCKLAWQTYGQSYGQWDTRAQLRQCANALSDGVDHDYDEAWADDYGQWPRPGNSPLIVKAADVEQPQIDQLDRMEALLANGIGRDLTKNPPTFDGVEWAGSPRQIATAALNQAELAAARAADCSAKLDRLLAAIGNLSAPGGPAVDVGGEVRTALSTLVLKASV